VAHLLSTSFILIVVVARVAARNVEEALPQCERVEVCFSRCINRRGAPPIKCLITDTQDACDLDVGAL
jgi:hypothetical protein